MKDTVARELLASSKDCLDRFVTAFPHAREFDPIKRAYAAMAAADLELLGVAPSTIDGFLRGFYEEGRSIRRKSWPPGDHIDTDGAEGGTLWYYTDKDDELTPGYRLGFHELGAGDWEWYR